LNPGTGTHGSGFIRERGRRFANEFAPTRTGLWLLLVALCSAPASAQVADSETDGAARLRAIRHSIEDLEQSLNAGRAEAGELRAEVARADAALAEAAARQAQYRHSIERRAEQLERLAAQLDDAHHRLGEQRRNLAATVRNIYLVARESRLKLLLNHEDPATLSRYLGYHDYLLRATEARLAQSKTEFDELRGIETALRIEQASLERLEAEAAAHQAALSELKDTQSRSLGSLEKRIDGQSLELDRLRDEEHELVDLIAAIRTEQPAAIAPSGAPFSESKGLLPWPAAGRVLRAPGSALREGGAPWQGVLIETEPGAEVRAVGGGLVVFADSFRALGLLIIIDHGDGYMSLYGHNRKLFKQAGDPVHANDVIGSVGGAGSAPNTLYFEIRHAGGPLDPREWCAAR
jgi:septal ring factor EnvC (AmiA/AmiB activator)